MITLLSKSGPYLSILLVLIFTSSCQFPGGSQAIQQNSDQIPDSDTFVLPEVKIEADIPEDKEGADFMLELHIYRVNKVSEKGVDYTQEDLVLIEVIGFEDVLYGHTSEGQQTVTVVDDGGCILDCSGTVGYIINGFISEDCLLNLNIAHVGIPATCTSSCVSDPGFTVQWYTGVGEHHLDPIIVSFSELDEGYTRTENLGNSSWTAIYQLSSLSGKVQAKGCEDLKKELE
ncbi:MAG: hypothetical protein WBB69_01200 [Anaerolineales bacterium]